MAVCGMRGLRRIRLKGVGVISTVADVLERCYIYMLLAVNRSSRCTQEQKACVPHTTRACAHTHKHTHTHVPSSGAADPTDEPTPLLFGL
eukprot:148820-Amphidinium_carterae.1